MWTENVLQVRLAGTGVHGPSVTRTHARLVTAARVQHHLQCPAISESCCRPLNSAWKDESFGKCSILGKFPHDAITTQVKTQFYIIGILEVIREPLGTSPCIFKQTHKTRITYNRCFKTSDLQSIQLNLSTVHILVKLNHGLIESMSHGLSITESLIRPQILVTEVRPLASLIMCPVSSFVRVWSWVKSLATWSTPD